MGPPTLAIVALTFLQIGLVLLAHDWVQHRLDTSPGWQRLFRWVSTNSLPLHLLHTTGMAITIALLFVIFDYLPPAEPTIEWWISRPLWFFGPALATYPFLLLFAKISGRGPKPINADELAT
jgi:hypothetical protein